ncbi:HEPN domain-containing protein [Flavilitoribacter nigricans]|uniref:Nitrite reductase n=1 Tax=Flavilitoribacter nigricans (strain ATCC 23147 / DSM 23189 / NBRC 102662 / NCIMB 1420 / SS-2) TaxID=1122177 RepID=A0A2D0NCI8_FLAN2|nr:HEPN domain-containing protein [Flavilitoribacter nigricans]PHN06224.1 nitrite reductase [Flavilitoribacter nigricans DSM 23189 = NBRC 102662]
MSAFDFSKVSEAARKDIIELDRRINDFNSGKEDEERFKHYRLTRGVYGQRQFGVQMFRTKIPYGKLTSDQLAQIANVSEKYTNGNLHLTTRQNIQMHYVKLADSPAIWTELASAGVTAREACGNTVRNITASPTAGVDPEEPFDVSPYVHAVFEYFLRNPICQDMGRKIKPAFSATERDSAFTYFHDFGFIPRLRIVNGKEVRGFKVVLAGGLGAVPFIAPTVYDFMETDQIIPFMEATIRVFDRYGEREKRMKARMKFLLQKLGLENFLELIEVERRSLLNQSVPIEVEEQEVIVPELPEELPVADIDQTRYEFWKNTNTFEQKQKGWYAAYIRVPLGDIQAEEARQLAAFIKKYAADDIRITVNQGLLVRYLRPEVLPLLYQQLEAIGYGEGGADSIADVTACPGTDTCALGVTNSTGLADVLSQTIQKEYPALITDSEIKIKISGCMNACGQHMAAQIGFHGSSIKRDNMVIPAMQVVLGGGVSPEGKGSTADKVIKLPTKRIPDAIRALLNDFAEHKNGGEIFNDFYQRNGKRYFYNLLKPLAELDELTETDFFDWGQNEQYEQEIGVGECAGVSLDVVGTIINDAREKIELAEDALETDELAAAVYHAYTSFVIGAKALLLSKDVKCNTHIGILDSFQEAYINAGEFPLQGDFASYVLRINEQQPNTQFTTQYLQDARAFVANVIRIREDQLQGTAGVDKLVIGNYYKA